MLFLAVFFAGPQLGSLDADLDGVAGVPVIGAPSVRPFEVRDTVVPIVVRTPQFSSASAPELAGLPHKVGADLSPWPPLEPGSPSLRC